MKKNILKLLVLSLFGLYAPIYSSLQPSVTTQIAARAACACPMPANTQPFSCSQFTQHGIQLPPCDARIPGNLCEPEASSMPKGTTIAYVTALAGGLGWTGWKLHKARHAHPQGPIIPETAPAAPGDTPPNSSPSNLMIPTTTAQAEPVKSSWDLRWFAVPVCCTGILPFMRQTNLPTTPPTPTVPWRAPVQIGNTDPNNMHLKFNDLGVSNDTNNSQLPTYRSTDSSLPGHPSSPHVKDYLNACENAFKRATNSELKGTDNDHGIFETQDTLTQNTLTQRRHASTQMTPRGPNHNNMGTDTTGLNTTPPATGGQGKAKASTTTTGSGNRGNNAGNNPSSNHARAATSKQTPTHAQQAQSLLSNISAARNTTDLMSLEGTLQRLKKQLPEYNQAASVKQTPCRLNPQVREQNITEFRELIRQAEQALATKRTELQSPQPSRFGRSVTAPTVPQNRSLSTGHAARSSLPVDHSLLVRHVARSTSAHTNNESMPRNELPVGEFSPLAAQPTDDAQPTPRADDSTASAHSDTSSE